MPSHARIDLHGLFLLFIALLCIQFCIFSTCYVWTVPLLPSPTLLFNVQPVPPNDQPFAESVTRSSSMHRIVVATLAVIVGGLISQATAQAPIPSRPPGFIYGTGACDAPVHLEAWVDLICPDSQAAWPTYRQVADYYGPDVLKFSALLFPLPYHKAAMLAAQGAFVADSMDPNNTYAWFDNVFDKQEVLYDSNIAEQPNSYIVNTLSEWAAEVGYSKSQFEEHLARSDPTQSLARVEFKYGGTRGVFETPQTYINGALVFSDPTWNLDQWKKVINPLLAQNKFFHGRH